MKSHRGVAQVGYCKVSDPLTDLSFVVTAWVGMEHGENGRFAVGLTGILRVGHISQDGLAEDSRNFKGPSLCPVVSPC